MEQFLSVKQVALMVGEPYETVRSLARRRIASGAGSFPLPACVIGETGSRAATYGWAAADVDAWHSVYVKNRPHSRAAKTF